ncbi:glycoside hydrolase family 127 protein [Isoptericola sp. NEAU-Y5]|uniref:Glycoside hydrolase family 127 protein n=1 Tax=Isoptericola luteus TaxID=2879484 RepID=A0ABS7ZDH8_9MICO|nr:beta-L-arabinofuranosidase domain-containing protein [Isoptericola sp. NEAU-Y5]MCA5892512.1 glycoside hydrolase family 127 protein [Isoptericola sp. NEAU-Y5]
MRPSTAQGPAGPDTSVGHGAPAGPPGRPRHPASPGVHGPVGGPLSFAAVRPLPADAVRLRPTGLLGAWQERNGAATIPHCLDALETSGALDNLRRLLPPTDPERHGGPYRGFNFADSDVHKTLEALAWEASRTGNGTAGTPAHEETAQRIIALLARVQAPSGYLDSHVQGGAAPFSEPYTDLRWGHELYVLGHLVQAGVARARTTGNDDLLDVAMAWADDVADRLDAGEALFCGHPEVESALVELSRETGDARYLAAARRMLELRGHGRLGSGPFGPAYHQDATPVARATEVTGHAVRQLYLLAGVVDVVLETGDAELLAAAQRLWDDAAGRRTYVTGGMGSRHKDESFGDPYELPPDRAYAESCAGIASIQWAWRMLLATGDGRYADAVEHALHNVVAAAVSLDGTRFFYSNPLQVRDGHDGSDEYQASGRRGWFACACCPPNLARLLASLHTMVATSAADGTVALHLYADADVVLGETRLSVRTGYPWDGDVVLTAAAPLPAIALRVPGWADPAAVRLTVDGVPAPVAVRSGYAEVPAGAREVRLELPLEVRVLRAHPRVDAVRGCVALARGPVVHCFEQVDVDASRPEPGAVVLDDVELDLAHPVTVGPADPELGVGAVLLARGRARGTAPAPLYAAESPDAADPAHPVTLRAVPYAVWGNRGEGPMRVWIPAALPERR